MYRLIDPLFTAFSDNINYLFFFFQLNITADVPKVPYSFLFSANIKINPISAGSIMIGSILALIYSDGVDQSASLLTTIIELTAFAIIKVML
jgi:hypothetical protein